MTPSHSTPTVSCPLVCTTVICCYAHSILPPSVYNCYMLLYNVIKPSLNSVPTSIISDTDMTRSINDCKPATYSPNNSVVLAGYEQLDSYESDPVISPAVVPNSAIVRDAVNIEV